MARATLGRIPLPIALEHCSQGWLPIPAMVARRILVLGVGPLPHEAEAMLCAPGLRVDFIARRLAEVGHHVTVGRALFEQVAGGTAPSTAGSRDPASGTAPFPVIPFLPNDPGRLRAWFAEHPHDAVIACTDAMANLATLAKLPAPLMVDWFGDPLCERQLQGARAQHDASLLDGWRAMLPALLGADAFTVCCPEHRHLLLGQLSAVGRLNRWTAHRELIHYIRPAWSFAFPPPPPGEAPYPAIRGRVVPADAFVVLWSGGYNNWADIESLYPALEQLMEAVPEAHFVSTGGAIAGHAEGPFAEFMSWVEESPRRERFHFLGWVPTHAMPALYAEASVALNLDRPSVEGEVGTRNRLLDWARFGATPVTTPLCELARAMIGAGAAAPVAMNDPAGVAATLVELALDDARRGQLREKALTFVERWTAEALATSVLARAESPQAAPDLPAPAARPGCNIVMPNNDLARLHAEALLGGAVQRQREDNGSRLYRLYRAMRRG